MNPDDPDKCSLCGLRARHLFSNRPLHKGRQETLLICPACVESAARDLAVSAAELTCSWCGGSASAVARGRYSICQSCISLCRSIVTAEKGAGYN